MCTLCLTTQLKGSHRISTITSDRIASKVKLTFGLNSIRLYLQPDVAVIEISKTNVWQQIEGVINRSADDETLLRTQIRKIYVWNCRLTVDICARI